MTTYPKPQDRVRVLDLDLILMPVVEYGRLTETIQFSSVQFSSVQKTLIIPQGTMLLWSWRACKIIIHKVERTIQQTQHHHQKSLTLTI